MRTLEKLFYIAISVGLATLGYATPLFVLLLSAVLPDPEDILVRDAVEREVGLAADPGTLDDAFLRDIPGPPPQTPEPGEAVVEPVAVAPAPPPPKAEERPEPPKEEAPPPTAEEERAGADLPKDLPENPIAPGAGARGLARADQVVRQANAAGVKGPAKKGGGKGSKKQKCVDPTPGISQVGDNEYSIERQIILDLANDLDKASKLAWTAWAYNDKGKTIGFTVKKIRCGSILDQAGLQNGDIIHEINGKNVTSITQAFGAWRKVRKKDLVRVKITRKGQKMELRYHIE